MSSCSLKTYPIAILGVCCALVMSALYAPVTLEATPKSQSAPPAPLNMREVRALKRLLQRVERDLNPAGRSSQRALKALIRTIPRLDKLERLFARYLHQSDPQKQRGAALMARSLILKALHERQGLLSIIKGRLCLRAVHRAKLAGVLLTLRQPRQAIEQLQRGATCTLNPQPFWDEAYLIAHTTKLPERAMLSLRASEAIRGRR